MKSVIAFCNTLGLPVMLIFLFALIGCAGTYRQGQFAEAPLKPSRGFRPGEDIPASDVKTADESISADKVGDEKMTLTECIVIALEYSPAARGSWNSAQAARERVNEKKSAYWPYIDFSAETARSRSAVAAGSATTRDRESGAVTAYDMSMGLRYLIYDGGRRAAELNEAQSRFYAARFRHDSSLQEAAYVVEKAYYRLLAAQWTLDVARQTMVQAEAHLDMARARHETGMVTRSDVLKSETELAAARLQLVQAKSEVEVARGELASAMNVHVSSPLRIKDIPEENRDRELKAVELLLKQASEERPELKAASAAVRSRQAELQAVSSEYIPELTARADYGWRDDVFLPTEENWVMGIGLSFPLFTGFERSSQVRRVKAEVRQAVYDYENMLRSVALEAWTANARVKEADEAIKAARAVVTSAEESLELAQAEYKAGIGSITELIDAQTAYGRARNQLVQARLRWYENFAGLQRAVGRSLDSISRSGP